MSERFQHKKSLGQHFLTSDVVPKWMCDAGDVQDGELILEVGPGTGIMTRELLKRGAKVVALEADERAIVVLKETFEDELATGQFILHHTDVRILDLSELKDISNKKYKVIANIPYYLTGMLFRLFLESKAQPTDLIFLVQKEVARRATSSVEKGEKESLLSLSVKAYGTPAYIKTVTKGHFTPPPKIDSGIIAVHNISRNNFKKCPEKLFFEVLHIGFGQKRKQLLGNLSKKFNREALTHIFSTLNLPLSTRAEDISIQIWLELVKKLSKLA